MQVGTGECLLNLILFQVWQRYDERLVQYIYHDQLQQLLHELDPPLRVAIPNTAFIAKSRMPMTADGRVHFLEVVIALTKKVRFYL